MKNRILILLLVAATLVACNSDSMISDDFNETAEKQPPINFKAKNLEGTYTLNGDCGANTLTAIGEGTVAHLGKSAILEEWCFIPLVDEFGTRTITFTAANGDELYGDIKTIEWDGLTFMEEVQIMGGTGRFENATGTFTETVEISDPATGSGTFTYSAEGTISY